MSDEKPKEETKPRLYTLEELETLRDQPGWEQKLYTDERIIQLARGEISLREYEAIKVEDIFRIAALGFTMFDNGRYDDAAAIFEGLHSIEPREGYFCTALGAIYLSQNKLERAETALTYAISLNEKEIANWVNRGEVYLRQGKLEAAADDFAKASELNTDPNNPLLLRAEALATAALESLGLKDVGAPPDATATTEETPRARASAPKAKGSAPKPKSPAPKAKSSAPKSKGKGKK